MNVFTKQRTIPKGIMLVVAPLLFLTWGYFVFFGESSPPTNKPYVPDEIELHVQAQQFVLRGLKAPSTAEFPIMPVHAGTDGNGSYQVISYVDSQNSFGAMIRSDWSVLMRLENESWILQKMIIGGKVVFDSNQRE
ncbi:MAG: hypothetical protein HYS26_00650 [Candidatus Kaiserbacteria bacterium]|nr:MAG: hypothetical protein HYS26_00650 [Candidatus Kaiserbacteria bacterium]